MECIFLPRDLKKTPHHQKRNMAAVGLLPYNANPVNFCFKLPLVHAISYITNS
jgi:hypothetical protein